MASCINNFCPLCNGYFFNLHRHVCRKGLMALSPKAAPSQEHQMAEAGFVGAPAKAPSISENYNASFQQPTPSIGTPEMGTSYLDLLDNIADPSVLKAGPSKDSQLELESFIAANLSGCCYPSSSSVR
ncbi:hypothetical protein Vafri_20846 [Volvox africanus]|uniref:Uncharacterized protein n=1 Tax=Volvox africanus TaxID=51714 RepID=A0A8J4BTB8_9CHLO|nr:hypothetical protein Vafri_20846 [Volvox africanus]